MTELRCKVLIIGGGPGGYVAAIRAGELGLDTVLIEDGRFGGACSTSAASRRKRSSMQPSAVHALTEADALNAIGVSLPGRPSSTTRERSPGRTRSLRGSPPASARS